MPFVKNLGTAIIRNLVFHAPWGAREAMLNACIDRIGPTETGSRLFPKMKVVEIGATGDRGIVTSSWNDLFVLPEYAKTGTFAETVTATLVDFFDREGGTYLDIGANIGLTTIPLARNPRVRCLAFEPEPTNFNLLKRNVERNAPGSSTEFFQIALFHSRSTMSLSLADSNIGDHRLTSEAVTTDRKTIEITALPLDDFLDRITGPLAIKVDTQGAEPSIIAGGQKVFARASLIAMEFCPFLMRQLGGDANMVVDLIGSFDRVAVMTGGIAETPVYVAPVEAQCVLREKMKTARESDNDYLDIIAIRDSVLH